MRLQIENTVEIEKTLRVEMLGSMFDMPIEEKLSVKLSGEAPLEDRKWNVGLIVGPSGSGKSLTLKNLFGEPEKLEWSKRSVIDDFPSELSMESISSTCQSVGFNTIPAWLRPFLVLSNGERFRVEIARILLSDRPVLTIDEFSSVVDRDVARITSHAVQKYLRQHDKRLVAASCHYDIIDWLQPDWIIEPGDPLKFHWRELQSRPKIEVTIQRVKYETWELFKNYHYMTPELNKAARCYGLFVDNRIVSFVAILYRPHPRVNDISGVSRVVTLPDWQGLGLGYILVETVAAAYKALGKRLHNYPNHPAYIRGHQRSVNWIQIKQSGLFSPKRGRSSTVDGFGGKRCAVFMYTGPAIPVDEAQKLINGE